MLHVRRQFLKVVIAAALAAVFTGCGSSNSGFIAGGSNGGSGSTNSNVLLNVEDDPGDRAVSFTVTINSVALVPQTGQPQTVFSTPTQIEVTKLAGTASPLAVAAIPQGTYVGAQVVIANPTIAIINSDGSTSTVALPAGPTTVKFNFDAPVKTAATPTAINLDLRVLSSIAIDASGNVTFTPDFHGNGSAIASTQPGPFDGAVIHLGGTVNLLGTNSFTLARGNQMLTFAVNSSTQFIGIAGLSGLTHGAIIFVDANTQADGSLLATSVRVLPINPVFSVDGIVSAVTGTPATQLTMIFRDHIAMPTPPAIGTKVPLNVATSNFAIDNDGFLLTGLSFTPAFDSSHVFAGQAVEAHATAAVPNLSGPATLTISDVQLEPQALAGAPSNMSGNTFTLTVASDSAFAILTASSSVSVITTPQTRLVGVTGISSITGTQKVLARGFLFFDQGQWKLVARLVDAS